MSDSVTPPPVQPPPLEPAPRSKGSGLKLALIIVGCAVGGFVVLSVLLSALLLPKMTQARSLAKRAACMANLNGVGKSILLYEETTRGQYPLFQQQEQRPGGVNMPPTSVTTTNAGAGQWPAVMGDTPMQNAWLLIQEDLISEQGFHCPADSDYQPRTAAGGPIGRYGWNSPYNYSYGMHWPYAQDAHGNANPAPFSDDLNGSHVVFADLNPGGPVGPDRKPSNHAKLGTGFLLASGSAGWLDGDASVSEFGGSSRSAKGDEIYANGDGVAGGLPTSDRDVSIALSGR